MKLFLLTLCIVLFTFSLHSQTIRINEVMSSNGNVITDADGDTPDWIEFFNAGDTPINLNGYGLSDKKDQPFQWVFPDFQVNPGEYFLVFASGKDRRNPPVNWNTIISKGDQWSYLVPSSEPTTNWRTSTYDDASWKTGQSGFGYGDKDDATVVAVPQSILLRKKFVIGNATAVKQMVFHMDYDDGFVAYLNGVEIARAQMDAKGDLPRFDATASGQHEALIYRQLSPEAFEISNPLSLLKSGENILAVQVHNVNTTSSDLTAIPYLSIGTSEKPESPRIIDILNLKTYEFHTNFKIDADGESLYLTNPSGELADSVRVVPLSQNTSYGRRLDDPANWSVYTVSTPGTENSDTGLAGEDPGKPEFSSPGGVYSESLSVALSAPEATDKIYYTLDGSVPTISSPVYSGAIDINTSKVIRARILKPDFAPGKTVTNSYLIHDNKKLPVVSISMNPSDLWDFYSGIYVKGPNAETEFPYFGANFWEDWEKPCHLEMIETNGEKVVDVDAGTKIYGNWTRGLDQKSMAIYCRKSYGSDLMKYKIFQERPFDEFKDIVLRNSGNDWNESMFRDGLMTGLTRELNLDQQAFRPAAIYLNGAYWGILNIREKINEHFIASNHNVDPDKVILLENNGDPINGSPDDWRNLYSFIEQNTLSAQANYEKVVEQIDLDNYTDYCISEIYFRNHDWPGNNVKFWKTTDAGSRWRWIVFDTDFGMGLWWTSPAENTLELATATDGPIWPNPPWSTLMLRRMLENTGFRNRFVNRFADLLNSTFLPGHVINAIEQKRSLIQEEMISHLQRWNGGSINDWQARVQYMKTFASLRPANVISHIQQKFGFQYPQTLTLRGDSTQGSIRLNSLLLTGFPWKGIYFPDVPVTVTAVPQVGFRFVKWEGIIGNNNSPSLTVAPKPSLDLTAIFESDGSHYEDVVINEISYNNAASKNPGDWIELYNKGQFDIDISGWKLTDSNPDHQFIFPANTILKANDYVVVCNDLTKMKTVFGSVKNLIKPAEFGFGLSSTADAVKLYSDDNQLIDEVNYTNEVPLPIYSLDELWSLELISPFKDNNSGLNWFLSEKDGTPGSHNLLYIPDAVETLAITQVASELKQNYPNPFSDGTYLKFKLSKPGKYRISIFDVNGRLLKKIEGDSQFSTIYSLFWDGNDDAGRPVAPGVYFYRLESAGSSQMKRMVKM